MSGTRALDNLNLDRTALLAPFDFALRTRVVFGNDSIDQLGEIARQLGARRVLVATDPGIVAAGHVDRGNRSLESVGLVTQSFDGSHENPTTDDVEAGLRLAKDFQPDLLVGLGGGSSMDCAKGINFLYSNGGQMSDYWGVDKARKPMLPMIAVPTTAGTGSELQSFALISDAQTHVKMACGDKKASCAVAILDPKLTLTQPSQVTALTGVDAISHALETYVTRPRNPMSILFSSEAWRLLAANFRRVLEDPQNLDARGAMQLGAALAGLAIENSMLGAAHALANPLTQVLGTVHGQAVGVMLPHVIRYNGVEVDDWYRQLMQIASGSDGCPSPDSGSHGLAEFVEQLVQAAGLQSDLQGFGVRRDQLDDLANSAARQWTGQFNPRSVEFSSLRQIYEQAF